MNIRCVWLGLLTLIASSAAAAGEVVINYEFSDQPHVTSDVGVLGSPGGGYWNRVGSAFFTSSGEIDRALIRDEFGNSIPPGNPFAWPPTQQVPTLRTPIFQAATPVTTPLVTQGPGIGSLAFSGQNIVELINTFKVQRYDIAVYYRPVLFSTPGTITLTDVAGRRQPLQPTSVLPWSSGFSAATFLDVRPIEMHIGYEGYLPFGFGVTYGSGNTVGDAVVEIAGVQIRGLIPEPTTLCLAATSLVALACTRRRK